MTADTLKADFRCRLCGGDDLTAYASARDDDRPRLFRCRKCGLVNRDLSIALGSDELTVVATDPADDTAPANLELDRSFSFLERFLSPPGRLLDVGCGNGRLMLVARRAGWDVKGLERSAEQAQRVRERLGAAVVVADLAEIDPDAVDAVKFDVLCLHFGLERVPDCVRTMTKLRALLAQSGHLLIDLANAGSWSIARLLGGRRPQLRAGPDVDVTRSAASLFDRASFEFLLRKTGYDLVQWETCSGRPLGDAIFKRIAIGPCARALIRKQNR